MNTCLGIKKNSVLISGGGGYIGSVMAKHFLDQGWKVRVLDRFYFGKDSVRSCFDSPNFEMIQGDIRFCSDEVFKNIDFVVDLASLSNDPSADLDPNLTKEINVEGAIRFAKLAKKNKISRYVYASSCSVYGKSVGKKLTENSLLCPVSLYAKSKTVVEKELIQIADNHFSVTIGRNATCYGLSPRMRFDLAINTMTCDAFHKNLICVTGNGMQWRPFVHIHDVAVAYEQFLLAPQEKVQKQIYNVGSDQQNYKMLDLAKIIKRYFNDCSISFSTKNFDQRDYHVSFAKIKKDFGFIPEKTIEEGVREIKKALENHSTAPLPKTNTVGYYTYLLKTEKMIDELKINGKLL